jgi:hypothetical protein
MVIRVLVGFSGSLALLFIFRLLLLVDGSSLGLLAVTIWGIAWLFHG